MTLGRFILGIPLAVAMFGSLGLGAWSATRRLGAVFTRPERALVALVLVLGAVTIVGEALGTFGWFALWPVVGSCTALGLGTHWVVRSAGGPPTRSVPSPTPDADLAPVDRDATVATVATVARPDGPVLNAATGIVVAVLTGSWPSRTLVALARGMESPDTLWYHLPVAVRFEQTGRTTATPILDGDSVTAFFPATSSLFHSVGLLLFDTDLVSISSSLVWLATALLAAWALGDRLGAPRATLTAVAVVLSLPGMVQTNAGSALTDLPGLALLLIASTLLFALSDQDAPLRAWVPLGLALGLMTGMKFTFLVPAGLLALAAAAARARPGPWARLGVVTGAALASGAYWYLRNWIATGNPLPSLQVNLGPLVLDAIPGSIPSSTVASLLTDGEVWRQHFVPGFRDAWGPAWPAVLVLAGIGTGWVLARPRDPRLRLLGAVAAISGVAYLFTPQYLFGGMFFATNLRYGLPSLVLGVTLLALAPEPGPVRRAVHGLVVVVALATQADHVNWHLGLGRGSFFTPVAGWAALAAALVVAVVSAATVTAAVTGRLSRRVPHLAPLAAGTAVLVVLALWHPAYLERRYRDAPPSPEAAAWVRGTRDVAIGVHGPYLSAKYVFYGPDRSNDVTYLAVVEPDGRVRSAADCTEWVGLVRAADLDFVAVNAADLGSGPAAWTRAIPGARSVLTGGEGPLGVEVFALPPRPTAAAC